MSRRKLTAKTTPFPGADVFAATGARVVTDEDWTDLALNLWQSVTTAYSVRQPLDDNLVQNLKLYELETAEKDFPFVNSSNIPVPFIPAKLDGLLAQIVAKTFVPEFYVVSGNTKEGSEVAYAIQQYYNTEFRRQRGRSTWFDEHVRWLHLALRDGTAFMEVLWKKKVRTGRYGVRVPTEGSDGMPIMDKDGNPEYTFQYIHQEVVEYDDVDMQAVWLRDLMIIPAESTNLEDAAAVARCVWLYESDLQEMIAEGLLDEDWVEKALSYVPQGTSDVASDRQGSYDKSAGGQIDIGQGQGVLSGKFFKNRGPIKVWRIHSRQYDMNGDGIAEENIFWLHEQSTFMLGWCPAEYLVPGRPFFPLCPLPRPDRPYGYAVPERLAPLAAEASKWHNDRNDYADMCLWPPLLINRTEEIYDKGMEWGPGKTWPVTNIETAAKQLTIKDVPIATIQEEQMLGMYSDMLLGTQPMPMPSEHGGGGSATHAKAAVASQGTRSDLIAMLVRIASRQVIEYVHRLKLQYLPPDKKAKEEAGTKATMSLTVLGQDVKIDVAGVSDPLDADTHFESILGMYNLLSQDHDIAADAVKRYNLKKQLLQAARWVNVEAIIGSDEDAKKKLQSEQQAMQKQQQQQHDLADAEILEKKAKAHKESASTVLDAQQQAHDQQMDQQQQQDDQMQAMTEQVGAAQPQPAGGDSAGSK